MSTSPRPLALAAAPAVGLLFVAGCASIAGPAAAPTSTTVPSDQRLEEAHPAPPEGRVIGVGMVRDTGGDVQLCLGAIMESYPPQCDGVPVDGWTWDGLAGSESSNGTTWGDYAVHAAYDGERLTVTDPPIMAALYDSIAPEDPTGGVDGTTSDEELASIQNDLEARLSAEVTTVATHRGYLWVQVVWDDGTIQAAADAEYGEDVVVVSSALRETD